MDRVFLDANVLFSAAYRDEAGLAKLWSVRGAKMLTSAYAIMEARMNLGEAAQHERLAGLVSHLTIVAPATAVPLGIVLPDKDAPILASALRAKATHLLTGDARHFGEFYGREINGCVILRPAVYLKDHNR
jgi:uncharacterized protein